MRFCPGCANMLLIEHSDNGLRFFCDTCPYVYGIRSPIVNTIHLERKKIDDLLGGMSSWDNVAQTDALCPKCSCKKAYFFQLQTRSADEPMTNFYKCTNFDCQARWKD